jgi:hypothetical protein
MKPFAVTSKLVKDIDMTVFDEMKRRMVGADKVVNVGVPEGQKETDGTPVAMIAAVHEYGSPAQGIPERPFLRVAIQKNRLKYVRLNRINLVKMLRGQMDVDQALGQLGEIAKGDVVTEIRSGNFTPLKDATIQRKGSSRPLIDTGQMVQSMQWQLGRKND